MRVTLDFVLRLAAQGDRAAMIAVNSILVSPINTSAYAFMSLNGKSITIHYE